MSDSERFLNRLVQSAKAVAFGSGESEMDTVAIMVSILHQNPSWIERFMAEGTSLFIDVGLYAEKGSLNWRAKNGNIVSPQELFEHLGKNVRG